VNDKNSALYLPFRFIACPKLNLEPTLPTIGPLAMFAVLIVSYFFIVSGFVFDIIRSPPAYGATMDDYGRRVPETILPYQLNSQLRDKPAFW
jgi:hypothetical protein